MKNCLYRMIGHCPTCVEDFDPNHHPNNRDCPRLRPVYTAEVQADNPVSSGETVDELTATSSQGESL